MSIYKYKAPKKGTDLSRAMDRLTLSLYVISFLWGSWFLFKTGPRRVPDAVTIEVRQPGPVGM